MITFLLNEIGIINSPKEFFNECPVSENTQELVMETFNKIKERHSIIKMQDATRTAIKQGTTTSEVSTAEKQEQYSKEQSNTRKNEGGPNL